MTPIPAAETASHQLAALLLQMSRRDEAAFEKLYCLTKRKIFSIILLIVRRRHLAEEVLQEAYIRIWQNAVKYKPSLGSPMNWMIFIARNLAIDTARKPVREIHSDDSVLLGFPTSDPSALDAIELLEDQTNTFSQRLNVLYALRTLEPTKRQLIFAAYFRGESRKKLSQHYGVPVNTIKTWIRRAVLETRANLRTTTLQPLNVGSKETVRHKFDENFIETSAPDSCNIFNDCMTQDEFAHASHWSKKCLR